MKPGTSLPYQSVVAYVMIGVWTLVIAAAVWIAVSNIRRWRARRAQEERYVKVREHVRKLQRSKERRVQTLCAETPQAEREAFVRVVSSLFNLYPSELAAVRGMLSNAVEREFLRAMNDFYSVIASPFHDDKGKTVDVDAVVRELASDVVFLQRCLAECEALDAFLTVYCRPVVRERAKHLSSDVEAATRVLLRLLEIKRIIQKEEFA